MVSIIESTKALFSDKENRITHLYLFFAAAVISIISSYFEIHKNAGLLTILLAVIIYAALSIYLGGYTLKFMNNVFHNNESVLPDFDKEPFKIFAKAIPLYVIWFVYTLIYVIAAALVTSITAAAFQPAFLFIPAAVVLLLVLFIPFISYIYVAYSKNYDTQGLYKISLPIAYMKKTFTETWITILKFIVFGILAMVPIVIFAIIIAMFAGSNSNAMTYVISVLGGYVSLILTFIWEYCLVKIYKNKLDTNNEIIID